MWLLRLSVNYFTAAITDVVFGEVTASSFFKGQSFVRASGELELFPIFPKFFGFVLSHWRKRIIKTSQQRQEFLDQTLFASG